MENPTLIKLLDRLAELRPDICNKMPYGEYGITDATDGMSLSDAQLKGGLGKVNLSHLKGFIERAIEAEIDRPGNSWTGYVTGQSLADGKFACLWVWGSEQPIKRRMQENQTIALLACYVTALEQEAEAS